MDEGGRRGGKGREEGNNKMAQHPDSIGMLQRPRLAPVLKSS